MGGGITRMWRSDFPAPMNAALAIVLELHQVELSRPHEVDVLVQGEDGEEIARAKGGFQTDTEVDVGETLLVPFALPLHAVGLPKPGRYSVEIAVDGIHQRTLQFQAHPRSENPALGGPGA